MFIRCVTGVVLSLGFWAAYAFAQAPRVEVIAYRGWQQSYRLTNGTVEVIVVPSIARIVHYSFVGEQNTIWLNPATEGKPVQPGVWLNHGGDKAWIWRQEDWEKYTARAWPPPPATDQVPHQVEVLPDNALRLTSPVVAGYGLRIVREVRLEPKGTRVRITTRLEKLRDGAPYPVAPWVVAQLPVPEALLVKLHPKNRLAEGYKLFIANPWGGFRWVGQDVLVPQRVPDVSLKLGADADTLAWYKSPYLVVHRLRLDDLSAYEPGDAAQIYSNPDTLPYIELEFTAPLRKLPRGESHVMEVEWELYRIAPESASLEHLVQIIRRTQEQFVR